MRGFQRGITTIFLVIIILASVSALTAIYLGYHTQQKQKLSTISSFEECAKHYPVLESYPEQCNTSDGKHFTKEFSTEEHQRLVPPTEPSPTVGTDDALGWKTYSYKIAVSESAKDEMKLSKDPQMSIDYPKEWKLNILHATFGEVASWEYSENNGTYKVQVNSPPRDILDKSLTSKDVIRKQGEYLLTERYIYKNSNLFFIATDIGYKKINSSIVFNIPLENQEKYLNIYKKMLESIKFELE